MPRRTRTHVISLIDELGSVQAKIARLKKLSENDKAIRELLLESLQLKPNQAAVGEGHHYRVVISECCNEREITDKVALIDCIGLEVYLASSSIPLGRLDKLTTEAQQKAFIKETQTGSRTFKTIAKLEKVA